MISESKMVHKLWNILEEKGYKVGGEVKVVPQKRRKLERWYPIKDNGGEIIAWEEKESRQRLSVKEAKRHIQSGKLRPNSKSIEGTKIQGLLKVSLPVLKEKGSSEAIDLVTIDSERFTGFEVKDTFKAVETCIARGQLEYYIKGAMLDDVYLVIPAHECEHVKSSYRRSYLEKTGVGLVTLDENYNLSNVFSSPTFQHSAQPHLKENEAWLKQMLWNYFEPKFDVEGEGILPKPLEEMPQSELVLSPKKFLKKIDLFLLPKGSSITEVAHSQEKLESIGIEVKYEIKNMGALRKVIDQLNSYAGSGALTRLYLATIRKDNMWIVEEIKRMENRKFGLFLYDNGEVKTILEAPKLQMQCDKFAYMTPNGEKVTAYEFGKPKLIKNLECFPPYTNNEEFLRNDLSFYRVIYARKSGRGAPHEIDVLDSPPSYLQ